MKTRRLLSILLAVILCFVFAPGMVYAATGPTSAGAPTLTDGTASRIASRMATVTFISDKAGTYYWQIDGAAPTDLNAFVANPMTARSNLVAGTNSWNQAALSTDEHKVYIVATAVDEFTSGNVSSLMTISIPAYTEYQPTKEQYAYALTSKMFNGSAQGINITPQTGAGKVTAIYYNDSTIEPKNAGAYAVTMDVAAGAKYSAQKGLYLGTFTINKADLSKVKVTVADATWSGKQLKPTRFEYSGVSFAISANATVKSYGKNKDIGKGAVSLKGKGNFTGTKTITFKIVPKKNSVTKITSGTKQMKVTWVKTTADQKVTKYQLRYRVKGVNAWTTKTYAAVNSSATIKNLYNGKQYEVQVRSYKVVSGVKYYSGWSEAKTSSELK